MSRRDRTKPSFETMEAVRDSVDIGLNSEGDLMVKSSDSIGYSGQGTASTLSEPEEAMGTIKDFEETLTDDIGTCGNVLGRVLEQMIGKRLQSEPGDWELDPYAGAFLEQFIGEKMNQNTLSNIKNTIIKNLTYDGLIRTENLRVEIVPVNKTVLNIIILAKISFSNEYITYAFGFDLNENGRVSKFT